MNKTITLLVLFIVFSVATAASEPERFLAVTIDDLPVVTRQKGERVRLEITRQLLKHIVKAKMPVTAFVNEGKLFREGVRNEVAVDLLRLWLEAGCDLGNHTYSHLSLHDNDVDKFTAEILQGEIITKELLADKDKKMKYFRHPYLATGLSMEIKAEVDAFLLSHGYTVAPVSIDTSDWAFSAAFDAAILKGDKNLKKRIGKAYVPYIEEKTKYWEKQSVRLFGREIKQTLLLHANAINAEYLDDVAKMFKKRGYAFVSLDDALTDESYRKPDTFIKRAGISWLHRWALDGGKEFVVPDEPRVPKFVMEAAGLTSE